MPKQGSLSIAAAKEKIKANASGTGLMSQHKGRLQRRVDSLPKK